ncbi:hypothetical protein [Aliagarivorans taiwanensis]|uniref:hypothetical protein n=1 Tax=Aliagarivorans taiwanensis TaxID=561966 RepID=UPI000410DF5E|nr:hypothetical protein [Aliagarivorans taiwanensis]
MAGHGGKRPGAGRKPASPYPKLQQALRDNEGLFVDALNQGLTDGAPWALKFIGERMCAPLKPSTLQYSIPNLKSGDSPQDMAKKTVEAAAQGTIPADHAQAMLATIRGLVELTDIADIKQQMNQLEARYG